MLLKIAFLNYNNNFKKHGFQENINKAKKYLCQYGFLPAATFEKTTADHKQPLFFEFNIINSCVQITDMLNEKYLHHLFIISLKDNNNTISSNFIIPTGMLLLQTISQTLYSSFLVFTTRASPVLIKPFLEDHVLEENKIARKPCHCLL
jgi:hypothetical protein